MKMTNEFGVSLDRAGYAPSVMQPIRRGRCCCYLCGKPAGGEKMDRHEPWGAANRTKSKELGLWVELHHFGCHEGPGSVHADGEKARELRADAQRAAMLRYGWSREKWIKEFGKSELSEEECLELSEGQGERIATAAGRPRNDGGNMEPPADSDSDPSASLSLGTSLSQRETADRPAETGRGGCDFARARAIIREFWPELAAAPRGGFQILDEPEMPY